MSYRLQLPRRQQAPSKEVTVTPEMQQRRKIAMSAFTEQFRRTALLFPDGLQALDVAHPNLWSQIERTERRADAVALEYIAGRLSRDAFERALRAHEAAWRRGAEALAGARGPEL